MRMVFCEDCFDFFTLSEDVLTEFGLDFPGDLDYVELSDVEIFLLVQAEQSGAD